LSYDSDDGRALAGAITAVMTGTAYEQSAEFPVSWALSKAITTPRCAHVSKTARKGQCRVHAGVIQLHRDAVEDIQPSKEFNYLKEEARACWNRALECGRLPGLSQRPGHPCLAPTGTIAFLMDATPPASNRTLRW